MRTLIVGHAVWVADIELRMSAWLFYFEFIGTVFNGVECLHERS